MDNNDIKHLEFIQSIIDRMGRNSFMVKGWMITIVAASIALYAGSISDYSSGNTAFILVGILPTLLFWFLDSYYLQQERKFRGIYNDVAQLTTKEKRIDVKKFEMPLHKYTKGKYSFFGAVISRTIAPLYVLTILGLCLLWCVMS